MANLFCVKDKVVIITGGAGILGRGIAGHLAEEGAKIVILDRAAEVGEQIVADIKAKGGEASFFLTDVLNKEILEQNKKDILAAILGIVVTAAVVLAVVAVIILIDAGLLCLLGVRSASFGHLVGYVLLASVVGLPLELFTNGLAGALFRLGWASRFGERIFCWIR